MMTSRDRVRRAIHFQGVDRSPHSLPDDKAGEPRALNRPAAGQERAVGNNLGALIWPPTRSDP